MLLLLLDQLIELLDLRELDFNRLLSFLELARKFLLNTTHESVHHRVTGQFHLQLTLESSQLLLQFSLGLCRRLLIL